MSQVAIMLNVQKIEPLQPMDYVRVVCPPLTLKIAQQHKVMIVLKDHLVLELKMTQIQPKVVLYTVADGRCA